MNIDLIFKGTAIIFAIFSLILVYRVIKGPNIIDRVLSADAIVNFMKAQKDKGKTVLYSTHYLEEAQFLCDRILMIYHGKIVKDGSPDQIMEECKGSSLRDAFHCVMEEVEKHEY